MRERQRSAAPVDLFVPSAPTRPPPGRAIPERSLKLLRGAALFLLVLLFGQSLRLQVSEGLLFRIEAEENRVRDLIAYAPRGIFLDRFGTPLVQNIPAIQLVADISLVPDDLEPLNRTLREALPERDLSTVFDRLQSADRRTNTPLLLLDNLTHREFLALSSREERLRGLALETTGFRDYRGNGPFAQVLGYTGKLAPEERPVYPTYLLTETVGKAGLERQYETLLRGTHGARRVEVDAAGAVQHNLGLLPPVPGANLRLHLDAGLQERADQALRAGTRAAGVRRGTVIALEPGTGAVRALVSAPTFPHSDVARGLKPLAISRILEDQASPFLNRATQGQYVPGSVFKLAVSAGALEEGVVTPAARVESSGGIRVGQWFFPDWKAGGHGSTNLTKALAESVNTYFYTIGGGFGTTPGLGIERMSAWARRLGIGETTGIDLPGEASGFLPSPAWKEREKGEAWYIGDTYHAAIGQGDVLVTPLQIGVATAAIANGGTVYAPRLLDRIEDPDGTVRERIPPALRAEGVLRRESAAAVLEGMRAAVTQGSARGLSTLRVSAAAKTGTAQIGGTNKTHAWVAVVAPAERPELVLVVLVEEGGGGDSVAVPIAREVLAWYFSPEQTEAR